MHSASLQSYTIGGLVGINGGPSLSLLSLPPNDIIVNAYAEIYLCVSNDMANQIVTFVIHLFLDVSSTYLPGEINWNAEISECIHRRLSTPICDLQARQYQQCSI